MTMQFHAVCKVTEAILAFSQGAIVIVTDDDDRENEGDLIMAASFCTPEKMAFIIRNTCGIVCAPLTLAKARSLRLDPMVQSNDAPLGTAFTVSVDVRHGLTTGISAEQRCNTVRALAHSLEAADFVRPGHVFPLIAKDGGVLVRSGHTEAAVDLCKLAGLPPVGVIAELTNDDGTVMKGEEIDRFAETHDLKRISVADLIRFRQAREKLVKRTSQFPVNTLWGSFVGYTYSTSFTREQHLVLVHGEVWEGKNIPVHVHVGNPLSDVFQGGKVITATMRNIVAEGKGVLIYLLDDINGLAMMNALVSKPPSSEDMRSNQWREVGLGMQILRDLGVVSARHLDMADESHGDSNGFVEELCLI